MGYGKMGKSKTKKYSLESYADDLKALLEALSIEKPNICGRSLGGLVAQAYAIKYSNLKALVLANTLPITPLLFSDKIRRCLEKTNNISIYWYCSFNRCEKICKPRF